MIRPRVRSYSSLIALLLVNSCNQPQIDFPARALAIEGIYRADTYYNKTGVGDSYPIHGQTMTLKLISISNDCVRVEIEATPNGDYSPGSNRVFEKLLVNQEFDTDIINSQQKTCLIYSVDLPQTSTSDGGNERLRRLCKLSGIYYYFTAPVSKSEATVYFAIK